MSVFRKIACAVALCCSLLSGVPSADAKVEAIRGKQYKLSRNHGPWMIMVASFKDVPVERRKKGLTAVQAANQLVYELRKMGVPSYTFYQGQQFGQLKEFAQDGNRAEKKFIARQEHIAVVAGNFARADDPEALKILQFLKKGFEPSFLKDERYGGIVARTPGRPTALSRAHMTTNPLMSASDIKNKSVDPLLKRLNSDMTHSLLKNKGRYTLRVATYKGSAITQVGNQVPEKAKSFFNKVMGDSLDASGQKAWELAEALRSARSAGYDRNFEAYVLHERFQSIVTVGSFDSPNDPRIAELANRFRGKARMHEGKDVMTAEVMTIPRNLPRGATPDKMWMFDSKPKLMEVPGR